MLKVEELREIIKLIDESSINEFSYEADGAKVKLKKEGTVSEFPQINQNTNANASIEQPVSLTTQETVTLTEANTNNIGTQSLDNEVSKQYDYEICSPMVGTLYNASSPENDPYVNVGSKVSKDTIVCIVEAMKLFNEIEAEVSGEIVEILVENGELVEYGQPLFRVKTK